MRVGLLAVLVACGGSPAPAAVAAKPALAPVTCHDASVILRGLIASEDDKAGPARESAILRSCEVDRWAPEVLACIGIERKPSGCLAKLTEQQHQSYDAKLGTWEAQFGGSEDAEADGDDQPPPEKFTDCAQLIDDVSHYAPPFDDHVAERDWQTPLRKQLVAAACNANGWTEQTKECVVAATDPLSTEVCLNAEASAPQLVQQLSELDTTATKIAAAKQQPRSITCAKAVAAHYAAARWKDRLEDRKPADKQRQIAASRTAMQKACVADHWDETTRACIVVSDAQRCYANALRWGYPALIAATAPNLPAECGMYEAAIDRIATCAALPVSSRDAMKQAFDQTAASWSGLDAAGLKSLAPACKAAADAMVQAFPSCGGW
ncbi:MAG: hypothetical protein ABI467_28955 [Kofleriaceae bacterium]